MSEGTIVERLQSQRTLLVDVVHQIEAAIKTFGGTVAPNGNGNGTVKAVGSGNWISTASPEKVARWKRNLSKAQRAAKAKRREARQAVPSTDTF